MKNKFNHPFNTPEGYFENLKENILKKTSDSILTEAGNKNIYTIPEGFFEEQHDAILDQKASPVVSYKKGQTIAWASLAIAASIFVLFTYTYFDKDEINDILSKEGQIIQSDISDITPPANTLTKEQQDSLKKAQ